jgi:LCP family protein required for cell wall assembly
MVEASQVLTRTFGPRRPWLAAFLSFVLPGLGQAYAGHRRLAVLFVVPVLGVVLIAAGTWTGAIGELRNSIWSSGVLAAVGIGNALMFVWRSLSIGHAATAVGEPDDRDGRRAGMLATAVLVVASAGMHLWVGGVVSQLDGTLDQVFAGDDGSGGPDAGDAGGEQGEGVDPEPQPTPTYRWDGDERINVLLIGTDEAPGREAVLTDVLLVVSVDPVDRTAVMISIPRDTGFVPLADESRYAGGLYPDKINGLAATVALDPQAWCEGRLGDDPAACGLETLRTSIELYLGLEIHNSAQLSMEGFADMIDAVGGIELCLPGRLVDPEFDGSLTNASSGEPLVLPAGCHDYDGIEALAYARSRKGWIQMPDGERIPQNDFARNERQQGVLLALRRELAEADTFLELPGLLSAIARSVSTDFPRDQAGDLASLLPLIAGPNIERVVLDYPTFVELPVDPAANYLLVPKRDAIRGEMERLFGADALRGWYLTTDLPAPTPTADPDETPGPDVPSAAPSG